MKNSLLSNMLIVALLAVSFTSCDKDKDSDPIVETNVKGTIFKLQTTAIGEETETTKQTGRFIKFSFMKADTVAPDSDNWDIAFRGRAIMINGKTEGTTPIGLIDEPNRTKDVEVSVLQDIFESRTSATGLLRRSYRQDGQHDYDRQRSDGAAINWLAGSRESWYFRSSQDRRLILVSPTVFVFKTYDGHYAKMVIDSFIRTNEDLDTKEVCEYTLHFYYNPEKANPDLKA